MLAEHVEALRGALAEKTPVTARIIDTLRVDNGGILPEDWASSSDPTTLQSGFVAFVPAAGAASRYVEPLSSIVTALKSSDHRGLITALEGLRSQGGDRWALPAGLAALLANPRQADTLNGDALMSPMKALDVPKALFPCTLDGLSFLEMKMREHEALAAIDQQLFIVPPSLVSSQVLASQSATAAKPVVFWEQGLEMSTLRVDANGNPIVEDDGSPSMVPAGHGALARLIPKIRQNFPTSHSMFIRNIDNVMGVSAAAVKATEQFFRTHGTILQAIRGVRTALGCGDFSAGHEAVHTILRNPGTQKLSDNNQAFLTTLDTKVRPLWELMVRLFGMDPLTIAAQRARFGDLNALVQLFRRPVNTLGQVPNMGSDVGGSPVLIDTAEGRVRICLELMHATPEDQEKFMRNPQRATHFNPVIVAAEVPENDQTYTQSPLFWIMAAKTYRKKKVFYYETALYELLGNTRTANATFVEVPRLLFNPHKVLADTQGRFGSNWGLSS